MYVSSEEALLFDRDVRNSSCGAFISVFSPDSATAVGTVGRSLSDTYLLRCGHEVDGGVVAVVLLRQAEGELVVDEQRVCW